ncbi:MAG: HoxN/HupN/NixA family nickel/cobalt transporter, partial [Candidatus Binataceae bacterium]
MLAFTIVAWAMLARFAATSGASVLEIGALAYFLGLRHGFDADHVAAIDNVTRKLRLDGSRTITTGLYFALGHSTVVILMTLLLVLEGAHNPNNWILRGFREHAIFGMIVSASFLTLIGLANLLVFAQLWRAFGA